MMRAIRGRDRQHRPAARFAAAACSLPRRRRGRPVRRCRRRRGCYERVAPDHAGIERPEDASDHAHAPTPLPLPRQRRGRHQHRSRGLAALHRRHLRDRRATDKSLGIPGEDLPGSRPATEFVAWYNGHPDYRDLVRPVRPARRRDRQRQRRRRRRSASSRATADELARTDIADHALAALRARPDRGGDRARPRGPAQAAFTSAELRELGSSTTSTLRVGRERRARPSRSPRWRRGHTPPRARHRAAARVRVAATPAPRAGSSCASSPRRWNPGTARSRRSTCAATSSSAASDGSLRARRSTVPSRDDGGRLVLRSIGSGGSAARRRSTSATSSCCPPAPAVVHSEGGPVRRLRRRWINAARPRPRHRQRDAEGRSRASPRTCGQGRRARAAERRARRIDALLAERGPTSSTADGWRAIDASSASAPRAERRA